MKIIRLSSGLGNQLFMYAFYLHIKQKYGDDIYFDDKYYKNDSFGRKAELSIIFPDYPVHRFSFNPAGELKFRRILFEWKQKLFPSFNYVMESDYNDNIQYYGDVYFNGYWQTDKYIKDIDKAFFTPKGQMPEILQKYEDMLMVEENSVCIHFRRTDYFSPKYIKKYGVCTVNYYQNAMSRLESYVKSPHYYVFSDDLNWVRENIRFNHDCIYIPNYDINPYWYIYLMSKCKYNIISNSTFSWWGAYLNQFENKKIIAPQKWFMDSDKTIVLDEWIKVNVEKE